MWPFTHHEDIPKSYFLTLICDEWPRDSRIFQSANSYEETKELYIDINKFIKAVKKSEREFIEPILTVPPVYNINDSVGSCGPTEPCL